MFFVLIPIETALKIVAIAAMCVFGFIVFCVVSAAFDPTPPAPARPLCSQSVLDQARGGLTVEELAFLNGCRLVRHLPRP